MGRVLQGTALLAVLWWAWVGYSWLTNAVPAEEAIPARPVILAAMTAMLVDSLAVPGAFDEYGVLFGVTYWMVRLLQVLLYALATGRAPERAKPEDGLRWAFWPPRRCSLWSGSSTTLPKARSGPLRSRRITGWHSSAAYRASRYTWGTSWSATAS